MTRIIELSHDGKWGRGLNPLPLGEGGARVQCAAPFPLPAIVLQSAGPARHEVRVPFHDSQVKGHAVLIQTGRDQLWGTDAYWEPGPYLSEDVIFRMVRSGARLLGVDFWVMETRTDQTRMVADGKIPIVEHLANLSALPRSGFRFSAIPIDDASGSSYPVHAFAEITS